MLNYLKMMYEMEPEVKHPFLLTFLSDKVGRSYSLSTYKTTGTCDTV